MEEDHEVSSMLLEEEEDLVLHRGLKGLMNVNSPANMLSCIDE